MAKRNPKQEGSGVWDCKPQVGLCPIGCDECFYNRPGAFYVDIDEPHMPTLEEVGDGIMRVNSGHDSNIDREATIAATDQYSERFFNTSVMQLDFPSPVVLTANPREESAFLRPPEIIPPGLMFVRLRVSASNQQLIDRAAEIWTAQGVPVVLTFMAYYSREPLVPPGISVAVGEACYQWKRRHVNSYWCATTAFVLWTLGRYRGNRMVTMCGTPTSPWCRDCHNCETC